MKLVTAVIKAHRVEAVSDALHGIDVGGITLTDVRGHGQQRGHSEVYRGGEYKVDFLPKVKVEVVASPAEAENVVKAISDAARTGKIGDGKVWVADLEHVTRIRTGETDEDAR